MTKKNLKKEPTIEAELLCNIESPGKKKVKK